MPRIPSAPRLPLVPDPLRRVRIPRDLDSVTTVGPEAEPAAGGMTRDAVERIWGAAVDLYRSGVHPALQLCLRRNGEVLLNRSIGHARGNGPSDRDDAEKVLVTPDTPYCVYSTSKAMTAMVVHLLDERGALHVGDRVSDYIPEYAKHGKEAITLAQVLSHKASVPNLPREVMSIDAIEDRELIVRALCDAKPKIRPGKVLSYHAVAGGFILGEVVQRATGKTVRDVLTEEILEPLGFRWGNYGVRREDIALVGHDYVTGPPLPPPISTLVTRVLGMPLDRVVELAADPRALTAIIPSANVVTTANELSRFFEIFRAGGELDGVRVMETRTIKRALAEQSYMEIDWSLFFPTRFSLGLMLGSKRLSLFGPDTEHAFGHLGLINIFGWADPERALSAALITSGKAIVYPEVPRFYGVMHRVAAETPKAPADALLV